MIGIKNHLLGPLYTIPITVGPYSTIGVFFSQNVRELAFCLLKEKIELFFKNRKLTSTWPRSINRYYESKVHTLKMFLSYYCDIQYSKHFPSFFGCKMRIMHNSLIKIV